MKPSEYLEKNFNKQYLDYKIKLSKSEEKEIMESLNIIDKNIINKIVNDRKIKLIELDKKFIDKEKLIHSLNLKIMTYHLQSEEYELNRIDKLNILKMKIKEEVINEILELLEE
jgi:hypothetical protein